VKSIRKKINLFTQLAKCRGIKRKQKEEANVEEEELLRASLPSRWIVDAF
jgi:hypothetical protein